MGKRSLRIAGGDILVCVNLVGLDVVPQDVSVGMFDETLRKRS
jgi:hypothetical protein